ncbi:MAG: T9SS C-terminal target domain-containing protein [Chitinophagaceae bacterium]|nr:MAG: T9SS C-terminal target domain-containing protein [Chitinophagaceae bacterium]
MKSLLLTIAISLTALYSFGQSLSPTVISSSGAFHTAGGYSLSQTVGETVIETLSSSDLILTQGFHQPEKLSVGISSNSLSIWDVNVFPNPTSNSVFLEISASSDVDINVELFDVLGKKIKPLQNGHLINGQMKITLDMSPFASGVYFVRLTESNGNSTETIRIQKID